MSFLSSQNKFPVDGQTVIITGGSQGLGLAVAKEFASKGANVVIVAQNVPKLQAALAEVEQSASNQEKQRFKWLSYDLRNPEAGPRILSEVTEWNNDVSPDVVFCCAGNCIPGFFASANLETHRLQMDTVYWTSAYMAHAVLQDWTRPSSVAPSHSNRPRHLIFTSSVVAFLPMAGYSAYTPAKAAMRAMADGLNQEVAVYNGARARGSDDAPAADIKIHIAFPMGILTPGYEKEQTTKPALTQKLEEDDRPQKPEELAKSIMKGLEQGQFMITSTFLAHIMKGWAMSSSQRSSLLEIFWTWLGTIIILFVSPDLMSKCYKWGKEKGMKAATI